MIIKHALLNLVRSKSRNSLILLIMMVIALTATIALTIQTSSNSLIENTLDTLRIDATIQVDREKIFETMNDITQQERNALLRSIPALGIEEYEIFATLDSVVSLIITQSISLNGVDIIPVDITDNAIAFKNFGEFKVFGYDQVEAMNQFTTGGATMVEGMMFDLSYTGYEVILHQSLALLNGIEVNDEITLTNPRNENEIFVLRVSGIFTTTTTASDGVSPLSDSSNHLLISTATLDDIILKSSSQNPEELSNNGTLMTRSLTKTITGTYTFASVEDYDAFVIETENLGLDTTVYSVTSSNLQGFEQSVQPLNQIAQSSMSFLMLILFVGVGLLVLFQLFITKQRQYDIGVYAAIGLKKSKIGALFMVESLILTSVAIILGTSLGLLFAPQVTDALLGDAIANAQSQESIVNQNFARPGQGQTATLNREVDYISSLNVSVDIQTLLSLMGLGLMMTAISSSVGVFSVARFEPLQILSERG